MLIVEEAGEVKVSVVDEGAVVDEAKVLSAVEVKAAIEEEVKLVAALEEVVVKDGVDGVVKAVV